MACLLKPDPAHIFGALGKIGDAPTVLLRSDAGPLVVVSANFNAASIKVTAAGKISLTAFTAGTNILTCAVEGLAQGDDVQLFEDCAGAKRLARKFIGAAPGGTDPLVSFRIDAA